jgi:hypothetical protein
MKYRYPGELLIFHKFYYHIGPSVYDLAVAPPNSATLLSNDWIDGDAFTFWFSSFDASVVGSGVLRLAAAL